jgi:hypothetical protein
MAAAENAVLMKQPVAATVELQKCRPFRGPMLDRRLMGDSHLPLGTSAVRPITRRM